MERRRFYKGLTAFFGRPWKDENGKWRTWDGDIIQSPKAYFKGLRDMTSSYSAEGKHIWTYSEFASKIQNLGYIAI
jgi:hypothetical protein